MRARKRSNAEEASTWPRYLDELRSLGPGRTRFAGVDLATGSSGVAVGSGDPHEATNRRLGIVTPEYKRGHDRFDFIAEKVVDFCETHQPHAVLFEAPLAARGSSLQLVGLFHVVMRELWLRGFWLAQIQPSSLKVISAGNGHAKKPEIAVNVFKRWGVEDTDDVVDAFAASRAMAAYVHPDLALKAWRKSLTKIQLEPPRTP